MNNLSVKPREVLGFTITVVAITVSVVLWAITTFQSKAEASESKLLFDSRISKLEVELSNLRAQIVQIGNDTQYIRGRLEPSNK